MNFIRFSTDKRVQTTLDLGLLPCSLAIDMQL